MHGYILLSLGLVLHVFVLSFALFSLMITTVCLIPFYFLLSFLFNFSHLLIGILVIYDIGNEGKERRKIRRKAEGIIWRMKWGIMMTGKREGWRKREGGGDKGEGGGRYKGERKGGSGDIRNGGREGGDQDMVGVGAGINIIIIDLWEKNQAY